MEKREEDNRPNELDQLTTDQLVHEKTAVQRGLLYFESLYGRPNTREERDVARSLYDRYRAIKRTLNRSASLSISGLGLSELPTIHEHEAMHFTVPITTSNSDIPSIAQSQIESPTDEASTSLLSTESTDTSSSIHENVHTLSIEELWKHLECAQNEKRVLRQTIKDFEDLFEEQNGRRMLRSDRLIIEDTYVLYKQKKAKLRLLDALVKKHMAK